MRHTFKDAATQNFFEEAGYVVLDLFAPDDIRELEKIYYANRVQKQPSLEISVWSKDYSVNKRISDLTQRIITARVHDILDDHVCLYSGFVSKVPGRPNVSKPHQDPCFVDEQKFRSVVVWVPLCAVDEHNGAMYVIKGSHKILQGYRGYTFFQYDYNEIKDEVMKRNLGKIVRLRPGQAIIYTTATFHYSFENQTDRIRIACTCLMIPREATPIYYHHNKKLNTVDVLEINQEFLLSYYGKYFGAAEMERPLLNRFAFETPVKVSIDEFEALCNSIGN